MGDTAHLPLIVVVKATEPSEIVDRHIEMYLVTGGTELCGILTVERLEETLFMRFRIEADKVVVEFANRTEFSLAAISCRGGYLMTYPLLPIVSLTCSIEWHAVHASPAWAAGVCRFSRIGRSITPLSRMAGS